MILLPAMLPGYGLADAHPPGRKDFRGVWAGSAGGAVCRSPDEYLLVYERRTARFPYRGSLEPDRECRILSVMGRWPEVRLRMSCQHPDPTYRLKQRFDVRQTLRSSPDGSRMVIETEPALGQPAHREEAYYCREPGAGPPPDWIRSYGAP
jgi:hypothetical protein